MRQVLYRSRTAGSLDACALNEIVEGSTRRNAARDLTGFLLNFDDRIIQFIEGPPAAVEQLLGTLRRDSRHSEIEVLSDGESDQRWFADWAMKHLITFTGTPALEELRQILARNPGGERVMAAVTKALGQD